MPEYTFKLGKNARQYASEYLNETEETRDAAVEEIREWYHQNPKINGEKDYGTILAFLRGCKFDIERTKVKLKNYYAMRNSIPEWFANRNPELAEIQELVQLGVFVPLRKFFNNQLVVIIRTAAHDPKIHKQDNVFKAGKMILDVAAKEHENAQIYGVTAIFDMLNISLSHARQLPPKTIKNAVHAWQNYHCRPKQLEFIYAPLYINVVLNIFKKFMSDKLKSRVRVHFGGIESLHKIIDKGILPTEYGGFDGDLQEHINIWAQKLILYKEWFAENEKYKSEI